MAKELVKVYSNAVASVTDVTEENWVEELVERGYLDLPDHIMVSLETLLRKFDPFFEVSR